MMKCRMRSEMSRKFLGNDWRRNVLANEARVWIEEIMDEKQLIRKHLELVLEANETTNLTRIDTFDVGMLLHVEDSLAGLDEVEQAPPGLYGDMGTGGGYPGIPLAIMTKRETVLIDSVRKKTDILKDIIKELGLSEQVEVFNGRLEELSWERPGAFSVLTARALSQMASLMELAAPLLALDGRLICYKANVSEEELQLATSLEEKLGMKMVARRKLTLSDGETERCIIAFEKYQDPAIKLPRKTGIAQKRPLKP